MPNTTLILLYFIESLACILLSTFLVASAAPVLSLRLLTFLLLLVLLLLRVLLLPLLCFLQPRRGVCISTSTTSTGAVRVVLGGGPTAVALASRICHRCQEVLRHAQPLQGPLLPSSLS